MTNIETRLRELEKTTQMNTTSLDVLYDKYYELWESVCTIQEFIEEQGGLIPPLPLKYK